MDEGVGHARRLANILHFLSVRPPSSSHPLSFSFSLSCPFSLLALCQPTKGPRHKRRETGQRHSTQLLLIRLSLRGRRRTHLAPAHNAHTLICRDITSPVRSGAVICSQLIFNTSHKRAGKKRKIKGKLFGTTQKKKEFKFQY